MANVDEHIERLISRQLDGELSADQELELNQALIRSSAARALMEEYEKNDLTARMVLRATLAPEDVQPELHPAEAAVQGGPYRWGWGVASGAAVAAAIAMILSAPSLFKAIERGQSEPVVANATGGVTKPTLIPVQPGLAMRELSPFVGPRPLRKMHVAERQVDRFVIPVIVEGDDEDEDLIPMWEVQRRRIRIQRVSEEL